VTTVVTPVTPLPSCQWTVRTFSSRTILPPKAATFLAAVSHIIPGPYFGYWNSSISEVISFWFVFG